MSLNNIILLKWKENWQKYQDRDVMFAHIVQQRWLCCVLSLMHLLLSKQSPPQKSLVILCAFKKTQKHIPQTVFKWPLKSGKISFKLKYHNVILFSYFHEIIRLVIDQLEYDLYEYLFSCAYFRNFFLILDRIVTLV